MINIILLNTILPHQFNTYADIVIIKDIPCYSMTLTILYIAHTKCTTSHKSLHSYANFDVKRNSINMGQAQAHWHCICIVSIGLIHKPDGGTNTAAIVEIKKATSW